MKIVYIVNTFPRLSETFILEQITGLIDRGHDIEVIACSQPPKEEQIQNEVYLYDLLSKTHFIRYSDGDALLEARNATALSSCIDADLVHAHFAARPMDIAFEMFNRMGIPYMITAHAYDIFVNPDIDRLKSRFLSAEGIFTVSQYNQTYLIDLLGHEFSDKIRLNYLGIDLNKFKFCERASNDDVTILFVGRLVEKKGIFDALKVFKQVLEKKKKVKFQIIGDGLLMKKVIELVQELEIGEKVEFLGALPQTRIIQAMEAADLFFLPSVTDSSGDREGLPIVLLEAQATGLPIVATSHSGIPEAVIDGKTAFLVREADHPAMVERICSLIDSPELRFQMGKEGRKWIEGRFDLRRELDQIEKFMIEIVNKRKFRLDNRIASYLPQVIGHLDKKIHQQEIQIQRLEGFVVGIKGTYGYRFVKKAEDILRRFLRFFNFK